MLGGFCMNCGDSTRRSGAVLNLSPTWFDGRRCGTYTINILIVPVRSSDEDSLVEIVGQVDIVMAVRSGRTGVGSTIPVPSDPASIYKGEDTRSTMTCHTSLVKGRVPSLRLSQAHYLEESGFNVDSKIPSRAIKHAQVHFVVRDFDGVL